MTTRARAVCAFALALIAGTGCHGGKSPGAPARYALSGSLGTYEDGSGRLGLAVLATVRDASGVGPDLAWNLELRDGSGASVASLEYHSTGAGSYAATWFPAVPPIAGEYQLVAARGAEELRAAVSLRSGGGMALAAPALATDASRIDWDPVAGAVGYLCRIYSQGDLVLESGEATPGCDISALPPGAYSASILALSVDLGVVGASALARPDLGPGFDVSEGRLGFVRGEGNTPAALIRAAGGAYDMGVGDRSLAFWLSIVDPNGVPTSVSWEVEVTGPNLPASAPLQLTYWAMFPRLMAWAPGTPAAPGVYTVTAQSALGSAIAQFTVGDPPWIGQPLGVTASDGAQGSAHAQWSPVAGAKAYLAAAYDALTGARVASAWVAETSADFPADTFVAGRGYQVFVAATDADMAIGLVVPTQVSVAENVFDYASFTAR